MAFKVKKSKGTQFGTLTPEGKVINSMSVDLNKVDSDDPLAYSFGFFQGKSGQEMDKAQEGDQLAPEYIRGFKMGKAEREGKSFAVESKKEEPKNKYDEQADKFLSDTNSKIIFKFIKHDKYFPEDKETRDIWRFKITKDGKSYSGRFGQSIVDSYEHKTPRAYDVLTSLSADNGDPDEDYENFADNFGYDRDSHSGRKIFKAVIKERKGLRELYSEDELNQLSDIS